MHRTIIQQELNHLAAEAVNLAWRALIVASVSVMTLLVSANSGLGQAQIQLLPGPVAVPYANVTVGDIARVSSDDEALKAAIEAVELDTLVDNRSIEISKYQLRIRLALSDLPIRTDTLSGVDKVTVFRANASFIPRPAVQKKLDLKQNEDLVDLERSAIGGAMQAPEQQIALTTEQQLERAIAQRLSARYSIPPSELQVKLSAAFQPGQLSTLDWSRLQLENVNEVDIPLGRKTLAIVARDTNEQPVKLQLPLTIALVRDVVITQHDISQGETIELADVSVVKRPISSRSVRLASIEQVLGKVARQNLMPYEILKPDSVQTAVAANDSVIRRNAPVNVIVRHGALTVTLKDAQALENGAVGDRIAVLNTNTKERLVGTVLNASTIEIR